MALVGQESGGVGQSPCTVAIAMPRLATTPWILRDLLVFAWDFVPQQRWLTRRREDGKGDAEE